MCRYFPVNDSPQLPQHPPVAIACRANIDAFTSDLANEDTCNDDFDRDCNGVLDSEEAVCEPFRFRRLLRQRGPLRHAI